MITSTLESDQWCFKSLLSYLLVLCPSNWGCCRTWASISFLYSRSVNVHCQSFQLCLTLCDPMDCNPPGSSVHGILKEECESGLAYPPPGDLTHLWTKPTTPVSPALQQIVYHWVTGEVWCWRRLLRVPCTARRSNLSILMESTLNIHWKDWYWSWSSSTFGHLMRRTDSLEKTLKLGKMDGRRRSGWQRMKWLDGIIDSTDMSLSKLREIVKDSLSCCSPWGHKESDMTERLSKTKQAHKAGVIVSNSQCCYRHIMELWMLSA